MGCKCANSNEEEEEIKQREQTEGNLDGNEPKKNEGFINNYNNNNINYRNKQNNDNNNLTDLKNFENSNEYDNELLNSNQENTKKRIIIQNIQIILKE